MIDVLLALLLQFGLFILASLAIILSIIWAHKPNKKKHGRAGKDNRP